MKITRKQLRKIIKEERSKLINEMLTKGERALGSFANVNNLDQARDIILAINNEILEDAYLELKDDHESQDMAKAAMAEFFGNMCQSMGYFDMYYAIHKFTK